MNASARPTGSDPARPETSDRARPDTASPKRLAAADPARSGTGDLLELLHAWSDAGLLRHLDSAFAAFVAGLGPGASPALLVSAALLAQVEGRGHSCLPLAPLPADPQSVLAWPAETHQAVDALWRTLPATPEEWLAELLCSPAVRRIGRDPDRGQPLVIDGDDAAPRLYLRRYWCQERTVGTAAVERSASPVPVDEASARTWLDRLFPASSDACSDGAMGATAGKAPTGAAVPDTEPVDWQKLACAVALRGRLSIITGGPGTGKTYTAARLLALLLAMSETPDRLRIALAAPTGKAAARLKQSIDGSLQQLQPGLGPALDLDLFTRRIGPARTLHALLGARPDTRRFRFHSGNLLDVDVVIVDEASMVHLEMMAALLEALPADARLILLGDKDQLASVEAGAVLGDMCRDAAGGRYSPETVRYLLATTGTRLPERYLSQQEPAPALAQQTVMLRESRRFGGPIGALALAVNEGTDPAEPGRLIAADRTGALFGAEDGRLDTVIELAVYGRPGASACYRDYLELLARGPGQGDSDRHSQWAIQVLKAFERFRILCAVREGEWGVQGLNRAIERALEQTARSDGSGRLLSPRGAWYPGRPVMVTRNDPALGVFNGDIGIALPAPDGGARLRVHFLDGDRLRSVAVSRLAHVETAFAMTVHKSQGSEFEHTVLVLSAHSGSVLSRELVYTGITRARSAFSLVAQRPGLLEQGVRQATRRESGLLA